MRDDAAHGSGGFEATSYVLQADASTGALTLRARRAAHLDWTTGILGGHHSFGISHIDGAAGRIGNDHIAGLNNADAATGRRATNRSFYLLNGDVTAACFEKRFAADGARLNRAATRCAMNGSGDLAEKDITACSPGVYATGDSIEIHAPSAGFGSDRAVKTGCHDGTTSSADDYVMKCAGSSHFQICHAGAAQDRQRNEVELDARPCVQAVQQTSGFDLAAGSDAFGESEHHLISRSAFHRNTAHRENPQPRDTRYACTAPFNFNPERTLTLDARFAGRDGNQGEAGEAQFLDGSIDNAT